jgi:glycosyltransferase involved in cell wall biosynthesis
METRLLQIEPCEASSHQARPGRPCHGDGSPDYSVVVPVYNEADNIGPLCRAALEQLAGNYELLIVYDFDADSTLPALAALPADAKPAHLRTVHNTLGRGVRFAIEAGMRSARAPVVLVTMADLSDDFASVPEMIRKAAAGADVVSGSRYMRGGRQEGGPWLKGLLSRTAGLTLHWLTGLPTHDPTNSFKAYRKDFLDRTVIESEAGFALGIELTVKAHFTGGRVEEVPASWRDRTAGKSRFKLLKWLPMYLRWYLWALRERWLGRFFSQKNKLRAPSVGARP